VNCECGHNQDHHVAPFNQRSRTGKTMWKRRCVGTLGTGAYTGEQIPCRCKGYVAKNDQ